MSIAFQATVSRSGISSNNLRADGRRPERPREVILAVVETRLERARDILRPKNLGRAGTYLASLVMWQESKKEKKQRLVCPLSMVSEGPLLLYAKKSKRLQGLDVGLKSPHWYCVLNINVIARLSEPFLSGLI